MIQRLGTALIDNAGLLLSKTLGATYADLNVVPLWKTSVLVTGATATNTEGAGLFQWDGTISRSWHDGGVIISPDVPFTGDMTAFVNATGGAGTGCWVRVFDSEEIHTAWYSPSLMAKHSDMFLKVWATARRLVKNIRLAAGNLILDKPLTLNINVGTAWQPRFGNIYGSGSTSSFFVLDILGGLDPAARAITIVGGIGSADEAVNVYTMQGVGFRCNDTTAAGRMRGVGLRMNKVHTFRFIDCLWTNLNTGVLLEDTLYGYWEGCVAQGNRTAVYARKGDTTTSMNLVSFVRCNINSNREYCLRLIETSAILLESVSFEGNGTADATGVINGQAVLHLSNIGGAGSVGITAKNCYFEANPMRDVYIEHNGNRDVEHIFEGCLFHPPANAYAGRMLLRNSSSAEKNCTLVIKDSRSLLTNSFAFLETTGFAGKQLGSAFYNLNNTLVGAITLEPQVSHFMGYGDGFSAAFDGTLRSTQNVISLVKASTGVYTVTTNIPDLSLYNFDVTPNSKFAAVLFDFTVAGSVLTVTCKDTSLALSDAAFRISGRKYRFQSS